MFQVNKDTAGATGGNFLHGGINDNIEFIGFSRANTKEDGSGVEYTGLTFNNGDQTYTAKLWDIDEDKVKANLVNYPRVHTREIKNPDGTVKYAKGIDVTTDAAVDLANREYSSTLVAILDKFMPAEDIIINPRNYEDLVNQANTLLGKKAIGVKLRLKLVYKNNYLTLPRFGFIELMIVNPPKVVVNPQYDVITKSVAEPTTGHPADAVPVAQNSDLPF